MEAKTMGRFIAALRKANGMTQKELAEKLHVSDKSVSRWERDEGSPDLSLIPVIAEVFSVSCDELLRGERKPEAQRQEPETRTPKAEKQHKRILKAAKAKYRSKSLLAAGIACMGLLAAMICNLAFLRAHLGFFVGAAFYLAAAVCQAVFLNGAFLAVSDEEEGDDVKQFKQYAVHAGCAVLALVAVLFAFCLPLITLPDDPYVGLTMASWAAEGLPYAIGAAVLCFAVCYALEGLNKQAEPSAARAKNRRLKGTVAGVCALVLFITMLVGSALCDQNRLEEKYGITFDHFDAFKAYMETDDSTGGAYGIETAVEALETVAYTEDGEPIPAEDESFLEDEVRIADGTPEGKVIGTFQWKNRDVVSYSHGDTEDTAFTVVTDAGWALAAEHSRRGMILCSLLCIAEMAAAVLVYRKLKN